ncbi:MAG: T9SS type A sorting domain-containing protein, partial [Xanthomarina sp.]
FDKNSDTVQLLGIDNLNDLKGVYIYAMDGKQVVSYKKLDDKVFDVSYFNDGVYILKLEMISGSVENIKFVKF